MLSVITDYSVLIIVFNLQFCIEFTLTMHYAICSSIYGQRATLLKLLHSIFHHLRSTLYALHIYEFINLRIFDYSLHKLGGLKNQ